VNDKDNSGKENNKKKGKTALHYSCFNGCTITSMFLVKKGFDINLNDNDNNTPFTLSLLGKKEESAITFLNFGSKIDRNLTFYYRDGK
jgi:uncharacterized protein